MKRAIIRRAFVALVTFTTTVIIFAAAAPAAGAAVPQGNQPAGVGGRLRLESLERLAPKAAESVDIELDGFLIRFAGSILSDSDADERTVKEIIGGLRGVYVKSYEFKDAGAFNEADLAAVREQLRAPGWTRVVDIKSLGVEFEDDELYVATVGNRVEGLVLLDVRPRQVTVINIVGPVDLDKLKKLEGTLRLPRIHIKRKKS